MTRASYQSLLLLVAVALPTRTAAADNRTTTNKPTNEHVPSGEPVARPNDHRAISALGLSGAYVALGAWTWVAWYRDRPRLAAWKFGGDGGFASDTYAGGADKLGHAWSAMVLTRLGASLLEGAGWSETSASVLASGLSLGALSLVEVNDGYYTEFSPGDFAANMAGMGAALAFRHTPGLDNALDFRVQWFPSPAFRRQPGANFAEDYTGQTYLLAFKPRALIKARESNGALHALQFINPVIGFETRGYFPASSAGERVTQRQRVFLGLTLDLQAIFDVTSQTSRSTTARVAAAIGQTVFEYVNLSFSTLRAVGVSREETMVLPEQ